MQFPIELVGTKAYPRAQQLILRAYFKDYRHLIPCAICGRPAAYTLNAGPDSNLNLKCNSTALSHSAEYKVGCKRTITSAYVHYLINRYCKVNPLPGTEVPMDKAQFNAKNAKQKTVLNRLVVATQEMDEILNNEDFLDILNSLPNHTIPHVQLPINTDPYPAFPLDPNPGTSTSHQRAAPIRNTPPVRDISPEIPSTSPQPQPASRMSSSSHRASPIRMRRDFDAAVRRVGFQDQKQVRDASIAAFCMTKRMRFSPKYSEMVMVHVGGIQAQPVSWIKGYLKKLGIDVTPESMPNISFIGQHTAEFLLAPHLAGFFKYFIKCLNIPGLRILENFNPAVAADPKADEKLKESIQRCFLNRTHSIIQRPGVNPEVAKFYQNYLSALKLPMPTDEPVQVFQPRPTVSHQPLNASITPPLLSATQLLTQPNIQSSSSSSTSAPLISPFPRQTHSISTSSSHSRFEIVSSASLMPQQSPFMSIPETQENSDSDDAFA